MSTKFCMECGGTLVISADGNIAICSKCGKSYTFVPLAAGTNIPLANVYDECQKKVVALMELGKKGEAEQTADEYLKNYPQDYRGYLLRSAIELNLYTLDPVDAVLEGTWAKARERLQQAIKVAPKNEVGAIKVECGEYCKCAESVEKIFHDMTEFEKPSTTEPIPPIDPEIELSQRQAQLQEKLTLAQKNFAEATAQYEEIAKEDKVSEIHSQPLPTGLFAKGKERKRREQLALSIIREKSQRLQKCIDLREKSQKDIIDIRNALSKCEKQLAEEKPVYLEKLAKYEKDLTAYEQWKATYAEKKEFFATNPIAQALKAKIVAIHQRIAECEKEIARLDKQSTPFSSSGGSLADYQIARAVHREAQQRLGNEKLKWSRQISDLRLMLIANKPKPPIFSD